MLIHLTGSKDIYYISNPVHPQSKLTVIKRTLSLVLTGNLELEMTEQDTINLHDFPNELIPQLENPLNSLLGPHFQRVLKE